MLVLLLGFAGCGGSTEKTDCNDGLDNDGDGLIDEADPGCPLNNHMTEIPDPPPPPKKMCENGTDDDGDMLIDLADPGCSGPSDDDETDPPPQCNDAIDNNGDGRMDFPNDPGCDSLTDNSEDTTVTVCSDGMDNDGDGNTDYPMDQGCLSAADNDEDNATPGECGAMAAVIPLPPGPGASVDAMAPTGFNDLQSLGCGGLGAETVFKYTVAAPTALIISTNHPQTTEDTVVYVRTMCRETATELGCDDDDPPGHSSTITLPVVPAGDIYVIVDGASASSSGAFRLTIEERVAQGGACDPLAIDQCLPGYLCRSLLPGDPTTCEVPECQDGLDNDGDGTTDFPFEAGCVNALDNTELIAAGDTIPACGNLVDDDMDMQVDYPADPGCESASDGVEIDECIVGVPVLDLTVGGVTGATGATSNFTGSCDTGTGFSGEAVYAYTLTRALTQLRFSTVGSAYDSVLYVRTGACAGGLEVGCADLAPGGEELVLGSPALTTYYVFVDGTFDTGTYLLDVFGSIPVGDACDPADTHFTCTGGSSCAPGTLTCVPTLCNDGLDNDGDGDIDAFDPGCVSADDNDETDPMVLPQCGDGLDNDGDTLIDYPADTGCTRASDNMELNCSDTDPLVDSTYLATSSGTTVGATNNSVPGCSLGSTAPEIMHSFTVPGALDTLTVDTLGSGYDTILTIRLDDCSGPELGCNDDSGGLQSSITLTGAAAGTYYIAVDGFSSASGAYTLHITGRITDGASCDPMQIAPMFLQCNPGKACTDTGMGPHCQ